MLNTKDVVVMGKYVASVSHLKMLLSDKSKDIHRLKSTDLDGSDKMNFDAVLAISDERMETILADVAGSEGTVVYLRLIRYALQSFMDENITATRRIYLVWYTVFFLRLWRTWISEDSDCRASNFITANAYMCIELNAHSLVNLIKRCRKNPDESFLPWLSNSQPCETFFRKARSQSSTYCTVINFSMLDFLHRAKRIQAQDEIVCELGQKYTFARQKQIGSGTYEQQRLPTDEEIHDEICSARFDAQAQIGKLGMVIKLPNANLHIHIHQTLTQIMSQDCIVGDGDQQPVDEQTTPDVTMADTYDLFLLQQYNEFTNLKQLKSVSDKMNLQCLQFSNSKGENFFIKKSTICWLMNTTGNDKISSDRIKRFITGNQSKTTDNKTEDELTIGDWCEFKNTDLIGQVIGFSYLCGSRKEREYTLDSVPISGRNIETGKGIGVMCNWFKLQTGFVLEIANTHKHEYTDIKHFKALLTKPRIEGSQLKLNEEDFITTDY